MTAVFPHKNNTSMNKSNTLYWKTATDPAERIEVRLVLNSYIDNDNLYVGLESRSKENPECWESYTDITVNLNSLPPFHAYVDSRDCNRHVHDFLTSNRIAEPAGFEYQGFELKQIHILGPAFTGSNSHLILRKKLDSYQLTVKLRSKIVRQIESVPIIPSSTLLSYAVMFHCAITGEKISADMISFSSHSEATDTDELTLIADEHPGIWMAEQTFLSMIREGNPDYRRALGKSMTLSSGMKVELGDTLRANKNNLLVLLTLCSRAAIEGGLNPSTAYTLNDYYGKRIEECKTTADTNNLGNELLDDYVSRVRTAHETDEHAKQIADICDYITLHIREPLSISLLSKRLGYTEYYFSHKFKDVMGKSVNNYIRQKKTEEAKLLLSGTHMSISEISDELSFSSRSFFFSSFQKETGMSPTKYRQLYTKS